ncbi:unnamed protein product [Oppiella nova]|uniref:Carboxylic ester hydrolase n=1 Tax=Oppiella nova TaxID=334625 RepID=A0A7R9MBH5_9ACAR|nr:unnamed protein product [Oppiella nova]CAG2174080.1 unnamed protein product [Oppiella nova]
MTYLSTQTLELYSLFDTKLIGKTIASNTIICVNSDENVDTISVHIKNGLINGKRQTYEGRDLDVFLGIPYAQPPIGDLRFKKPLPLDRKWEQPLDAQHWPPAQPQIYRCSQTCHVLDTRRGTHNRGSSVEKFYSGEVLSALGDVVVVTINYRLNVFGLLYTGAEGPAPGNMALWDQSVALEWVVDNIRYFGGDPQRVTLFGESSGAISTSLHTLSPITRNLFTNAIVMSGSALNAFITTPDLMEGQWLRSAGSIGCDTQGNGRFTPEIIACLMSKTPEELMAYMQGFSDMSALTSLVIDGQFIPDSPREMLASGDYRKGMHLLIGTTGDEGSQLLNMFSPIKYHKVRPKNMSLSELAGDFREFLTAFSLDINTDEVIKFYFNGLSDEQHPDVLRRHVGQAFGDFILGCPTLLYAKAVYKGDPTANVYQYHFTAKLGEPKLFCSEWAGSCHFDDIYPVFGQPFLNYDRYVERESARSPDK